MEKLGCLSWCVGGQHGFPTSARGSSFQEVVRVQLFGQLDKAPNLRRLGTPFVTPGYPFWEAAESRVLGGGPWLTYLSFLRNILSEIANVLRRPGERWGGVRVHGETGQGERGRRRDAIPQPEGRVEVCGIRGPVFSLLIPAEGLETSGGCCLVLFLPLKGSAI